RAAVRTAPGPTQLTPLRAAQPLREGSGGGSSGQLPAPNVQFQRPTSEKKLHHEAREDHEGEMPFFVCFVCFVFFVVYVVCAGCVVAFVSLRKKNAKSSSTAAAPAAGTSQI